MCSIVLTICKNPKNFFHFLENLNLICKDMMLTKKIVWTLKQNKRLNLLIISKSFRFINFLATYLKLNTKSRRHLKILILKKKKFIAKNSGTSSIGNISKLNTILIKKKTYQNLKNEKLIEKFNFFQVFLLKENLIINLLIKFYNFNQVFFFSQSISDEILISGKIKFLLKKNFIVASNQPKKILPRDHKQEIIINCKQIEIKNKVYSFSSSEIFSPALLKEPINMLRNLFLFKRRKRSNGFNSNFAFKSPQIMRFIFSSAFSFTEISE